MSGRPPARHRLQRLPERRRSRGVPPSPGSRRRPPTDPPSAAGPAVGGGLRGFGHLQAVRSGPHRRAERLEMGGARQLRRRGVQAPAALTSSRAASRTRRWSKAISPRSCSISAACSASTGPASTAARSRAPRRARRRRAPPAPRRAAGARGEAPGEHGRVLEECRGGRDLRGQRAAGRPFQLLGDLLIGRRRRPSAVPGAPDRPSCGRCSRQRGVQRVPFLRRRRAVGRRAHARARNRHLGADLQQAASTAEVAVACGSMPSCAAARHTSNGCRRDRPPRAGAAAAWRASGSS